MDFYENHQQAEGGAEFESSEEARAALDEERVEAQTEDPTVLANPTELREGAVSGGDPANTQGGTSTTVSGGDLPGNSGDAGNPPSADTT